MKAKLPIYMDNHATTRVDPRVVDVMLPYLTEFYGNPSSATHCYAAKASNAVEEARSQVAMLIGAQSSEIVFTSGATESNNLAIFGMAKLTNSNGNHLISTNIEHPSVLEPCRRLGKFGFELTETPVDSDGLVTPEEIKGSFCADTFLVSVMAANSEIGSLQPISGVGKLCREKGICFHVDAAQGMGLISFDVEDLGVDLMTISSHKMYGPKGIGALYIREGPVSDRIKPILFGGGQENNLRSGTLAVHQIVGMGVAAKIAQEDLTDAQGESIQLLRDRLWKGLQENIDEITLNGSRTFRLPNNLNVSFGSVDGDDLLASIRDEVAVSFGSACKSEQNEPSHVLKALGVKEDLARATIRFGLGKFNTLAEVDYVADVIKDRVQKLRKRGDHRT